MLSNISIGTRIALLVAASVVTLGLLGGTVTVGAQRMFEATAELDQFRDAYEHTAAIERLSLYPIPGPHIPPPPYDPVLCSQNK
ncbi:hypothetical protein GAY28_37830, partial [Azospirillum brasilense]|nr:hypothetical protein [Azospirillum brasilense]